MGAKQFGGKRIAFINWGDGSWAFVEVRPILYPIRAGASELLLFDIDVEVVIVDEVLIRIRTGTDIFIIERIVYK